MTVSILLFALLFILSQALKATLHWRSVCDTKSNCACILVLSTKELLSLFLALCCEVKIWLSIQYHILFFIFLKILSSCLLLAEEDQKRKPASKTSSHEVKQVEFGRTAIQKRERHLQCGSTCATVENTITIAPVRLPRHATIPATTITTIPRHLT